MSEQKYKKLSKYAKDNGLCYHTAWAYYHDGLIEGAFQNEKGTIFVPIKKSSSPSTTKRVALYARVSSNDRKVSLNDQLERLSSYAISNGYNITNSVKEVASGMNDNRAKLISLFKKSDWDILIVENKDRLTRFGFNYIKILLELNNKELIVVNATDNDQQDLVQDLISIIYSFSARLYGKRRRTKQDIKTFLTEQ